MMDKEAARKEIFMQELAVRETSDILDKARLRALHSKENGVLTAPQFHVIDAKINSMKKLKFTDEYERI